MLQTRGYKVVVRLLPHEVADLEPVLAMLADQSPNDFKVIVLIYSSIITIFRATRSYVCTFKLLMTELGDSVYAASLVVNGINDSLWYVSTGQQSPPKGWWTSTAHYGEDYPNGSGDS